MFTIILKGLKKVDDKRLEGEEISFENLDIEIIHNDCYNGKVTHIYHYYRGIESFVLKCLRCGIEISLDFDRNDRIAVMKTFIDGQKRKFGKFDDKDKDECCVIRKDYQGKKCPNCHGTGWTEEKKGEIK